MRFLLKEYPDKYEISDFWWKIHRRKGFSTADSYIPMYGSFEDIFYFSIFQDYL